MARVTIEDCIDKEENKFVLAVMASQRAHRLYDGNAPQVEVENDKNPVVALREIAEGLVNVSILEDAQYTNRMMDFRTRVMQQDQVVSSLGAVDNL